MAQAALWGQDPMRLTQAENTFGNDASHQGSLALDAGGKNTGGAGSIDKFYAPWNGKVVRADGTSNNAMYIESTNAVLAPNGTVSVQRFVLIHTNKYLLTAGQTFKQGDHIYTEGTKGGVGAHIHIEGGFGTWASVGGAKLSKNAYGTWCIAKQAHIYDMLFVPDAYTIQDGKGYSWKRAASADVVTKPDITTPKPTEDEMKLRVYEVYTKETFRTSQLVERFKERGVTVQSGSPVFLAPVSAHEVDESNISAVVDTLIKEKVLNENTVAFVRED